jgi:alkylated DNA repair protein (DNA oxidative demethylase)
MQKELLAQVEEVAVAAPPVHPETRWGRKMSVAMTSAGRLGWISDRRGYRYQATRPEGQAWPPIPPLALRTWHAVTGLDETPDCCLVNRYGEGSRMGLHQDRDEGDFRWPVVSISLGDDALFRIGSISRGGPTESLWLSSGDVCLIGGEARLVHHGIDRTRFGSSRLLAGGGRINLTLRIVR